MPVKFNIGGGVNAAKDTATADDVRSGKTFHAGKGGKSKIGAILDCAIKKITPGKSAQTIPAGSYIAEDITVSGDKNLVSGNIKSGVTIFGVEGDTGVVDTGDGNATAANILANKTAYVNGSKVIGTMTDHSGTPQHIASRRLKNGRFEVAVAKGYHGYSWSGNSYEYMEYSEVADTLGLTEEKLAKGKTVCGVSGTYTSDATAIANNILSGKTAYVNGSKLIGGMSNRCNVNSTYGAISSAYPSVGIHKGEYLQESTPTNQNVTWFCMTMPSGYYGNQSAYVGVPLSELASHLGLTEAKLVSGQTVCGVTGTKKWSAKQLNAAAFYGFGADASDYETGEEGSFTMPSAGTVYYTGCSVSYNGKGTIVCEIYKGDTCMDSRNINSDNKYNWRSTMNKKSFSASKGDVIKVVTKAASATHAMAWIEAVIIYFA